MTEEPRLIKTLFDQNAFVIKSAFDQSVCRDRRAESRGRASEPPRRATSLLPLYKSINRTFGKSERSFVGDASFGYRRVCIS
jgi:hypothetical protein